MKRPKILIVDDEDMNIKLITAMLSGDNYELTSALSGEEALSKVAEGTPDLILLDVMMPGMSGLEVCQKLKQDEERKIIPVIIVTALRDKENRVQSMEKGADDFLSKPVDKVELRVRVKSLLRIKTYHDSLRESNREVMEKNERLLELEQLKEGLIHMIIHDMRNPLSAISMNLELLQKVQQGFSENQISIIKECFNQCSEVNFMVYDLLDIQKMENNRLALETKATELEDLAEEVLKQFKIKSDKKQIAISATYSGNGHKTIVDARLMKRVLANLLNNAVRHTPKGGRIDIFIDDTEKDSLCLSVNDDGAGLAPEYHGKIFDKFEQAAYRKDGVKVGRSGLGLAFCKLAVEAHGGKIWVESEGEGKGCTFRITIPRQASVSNE
ncbi:response regulator [Thermodesulfobacteriota bacterium]